MEKADSVEGELKGEPHSGVMIRGHKWRAPEHEDGCMAVVLMVNITPLLLDFVVDIQIFPMSPCGERG